MTKKEIIQRFGARNSTISDDQQHVPQYVRYPKLCGDICKHRIPRYLQKLRRDFEAALTSVVAGRMKTLGVKVIAIPLERIMVAIDMKVVGGPVEDVEDLVEHSQLKFVGELTAASCRSAQVVASQTFQKYDVVGAGVSFNVRPSNEALTWAGARLRPCRRNFVSQRKTAHWPLEVGGCGPMDVMTNENLSEFLVGPFVDGVRQNLSITIAGLQHSHFRGDIRNCMGVDDLFVPVVVETTLVDGESRST